MENELDVPRGTTYSFYVIITYEDGTPYPYNENDMVFFGVCFDDSDELLISKTADYDNENNCYVVNLTPEDTQNMIVGERYWYDMGLQTIDGDFYRIIEATLFNVKRSVTRKVTQ
jgi:outer membrane lipoprotein-sorting protein